MAGSTKKEQQQGFTMHDGACSNCRTRKIRCGREKPRCGSCCRDEVECVYSSPTKRVNHVKVLCQNFDDIQDRLNMLQEGMTNLTSIIKRSNSNTQMPFRPDVVQTPERLVPDFDSNDGSLPESGGHIVRDTDSQEERYHGPFTLLAQHRNFLDDVSATYPSASHGMSLDLSSDMIGSEATNFQDLSIRLPPRQFLSVMLETFFKLPEDHRTDIFSKETVYAAVENVYKESELKSSWAQSWAVCFNLIILVVLTAENPISSNDPFAKPLLEVARAVGRCPGLFLAPRLVNVQALALLSYLAHQYQTESLADSLFSQACLVAKAMGLHLHQSPELTENEGSERSSVWRALYIGDRNSSVVRGTLSWLPNLGSSNSSSSRSSSRETSPSSTESLVISSKYDAQFKLAKIQHDLQISIASSAWDSDRRPLVHARLQHSLEAWSQESLPGSSRPTTVEDMAIRLSFLGTRMRLNQSSAGSERKAQLLQDARTCCLLFVTSCSPLANADGYLITRLNQLLLEKPVSPSFQNPLPSPPIQADSAPPLLPLHRLITEFPISAIFIIARSVLGLDDSVTQDRSVNSFESLQDMAILEAMQTCLSQNSAASTASCLTKLSRSVENILEITRNVVGGKGYGKMDGATGMAASTAIMTPMSNYTSMDAPDSDIGLDGLCPPPYETSMNATDMHQPWTHHMVQQQQSPAPSESTTGSSGSGFQPTSMSMIDPAMLVGGGGHHMSADQQFDISQFLNQLGMSGGGWEDTELQSAGMTEHERGHAGGVIMVQQMQPEEMQVQVQEKRQTHQRKPSRKRQRRAYQDGGDEDSD